jgi:hypothetical protein
MPWDTGTPYGTDLPGSPPSEQLLPWILNGNGRANAPQLVQLGAAGNGGGSTSSDSNEVSPVVATAKKTPVIGQGAKPPTDNYNNSGDVMAVQQAVKGDMSPQAIYGNMPGLTHGGLRNILGHLGDALLVGSGRNAQYQPRLDREIVGNAMAGYDADPMAAIQRVAATGAPGSAEMASRMLQEYEQRKIREAQLQQTNMWHEDTIEDRRTRTQAYQQQIADRFVPQIGGLLQGVKKPEDYASVYNRIDSMAKRIGGPDATPTTLWGLPTTDQWTPDQTNGFGMTSNQNQISADKAAARDVSLTNNRNTNSARITAAGMARPPSPSIAATLNQLLAKQNAGQQLTPAEQRYWDSHNPTHITLNPPGLTPGAGGVSQPVPRTMQQSQPPGWSPSGYMVNEGALDFLKSDIARRGVRAATQDFDAHFGQGAAQHYRARWQH